MVPGAPQSGPLSEAPVRRLLRSGVAAAITPPMVYWRLLLQASALAAQYVLQNASAPPRIPSLHPPPTIALPPPTFFPHAPPHRPPPASPLVPPTPLPFPRIPSPREPPTPTKEGLCLSLARPHGSFLWVLFCYVLLSLPLLLFLAFLLSRARQSLLRLRQTGSLVMTSYYALLWAVCIVNLIRCVIQVSCASSSLQLAHPRGLGCFVVLGSQACSGCPGALRDQQPVLASSVL